jgi:hypothetical protein
MHDEDDPAITGATAPAVDEGGGTYKTLSKWVILVTVGANARSLMVRIYQYEARLWRWVRQCLGIYSRVFHLVSTNGDLRLLVEEVTKRGEVFRGRRVGRGTYFPLHLIFVIVLLLISWGFRLRGGFFPSRPQSRPGGTPKPPSLLPCWPPFIVDTVDLPPHHIHGQGDPSQGIVHTMKTLHKNAYVLKKQKWTQSDENKLEQTLPGAHDPFP